MGTCNKTKSDGHKTYFMTIPPPDITTTQGQVNRIKQSVKAKRKRT